MQSRNETGQDALDEEYFLMRVPVDIDNFANSQKNVSDLAGQFNVSAGIHEPQKNTLRSDADAERIRNRLHELSGQGQLNRKDGTPVDPDNISIPRYNITPTMQTADNRLALREQGIDFDETKKMTPREIEVLARENETGALNAVETQRLAAVFQQQDGDPESVNYSPVNPTAGLNTATVTGRLSEGTTWEVSNTESPGLGSRHARLTYNDPKAMESIRDALNASGFTVLEGKEKDQSLLILPEDELSRDDINLGFAKEQLDITLPQTDAAQNPVLTASPVLPKTIMPAL